MHVCVMGAGIVGLATAYALQRQGLQVTVIDQGTGVAQGASGGNGAQLSYSYVQPLADAGIWAQLPRLLLSPDSPFKLHPRCDVAQWRWGLEFLRACNHATSLRTTGELLTLASLSRVHFERMLTTEAFDCDFSAAGKLVVYRTPAALAAAQRQMDLQQAWGRVQRSVSAQDCVDLEPALAPSQASIAGAIYTPSECAADCLKICQGLQAVLEQRGVRFLLRTPVQGFVRSHERIAAVQTPRGPIEADHFVLALGSGSPFVARMLGLRLPVYPLKGYSITLDPGHAAWTPRVSVTDAARKVVFARLGKRLRVAGMAELAGYDTRIPPARIQSLCDSVRAVLGYAASPEDAQPWTGMRPATPTGRPIVGRHPQGPRNLWLNTGHGALGFTLAFGTAAQVAAQLCGRMPR